MSLFALLQKTDTGWKEVLVDINNRDLEEGKSDTSLRFVLAPGRTLPTVSYLKVQ